MTEDSKPTVWQMVREAVGALGGKTTNVVVRDWILEQYPGDDRIVCQALPRGESRLCFGCNQPDQACSNTSGKNERV